MPEHRVISTFGEQPPLVGQTLAAIFLLFFIFQIREHWSQASACLPSFALVARLPFLLCKKQQNSQLCDKSLPKLNSSNCWQSLGANRQFRHFQSQQINIIFLYSSIVLPSDFNAIYNLMLPASGKSKKRTKKAK